MYIEDKIEKSKDNYIVNAVIFVLFICKKDDCGKSLIKEGKIRMIL